MTKPKTDVVSFRYQAQGDFFHIPPLLVHRDVNPDEKQELAVVNILIGRGEPVINVKSPK
jgi:uncharacterized RmlC-like cupin family protein